MMKRNWLKPALAFLRRNKTANAWVVITIALCMGCLLVMQAFGEGGMAQFTASLASGDPLQIVVAPGADGAGLNDAAIRTFQGIEGVEAATGVIKLPLRIQVGGYEAGSVEVTAIDGAALRGRLAYSSGGMFADGNGGPQIILGYGVQTQFQKDSAESAPSGSAGATPPPVQWLGQHALISFAGEAGDDGKQGGEDTNPIRLYSGSIAGILKEDAGERSTQAFMGLAAAKRMLQENYEQAAELGLNAASYPEAYVFVDSIANVQAAVDALKQLGFTAQSAVENLDSLQLVLSLKQTLLTVIKISLVLISILTVLCILIAFRTARDDDGARPAAPRPIGAAALGLAGGLAAVLLACFFALITNTSSTETVLLGMHFGQNANLAIPPAAALGTVFLSVLIAESAEWIVCRRFKYLIRKLHKR